MKRLFCTILLLSLLFHTFTFFSINENQQVSANSTSNKSIMNLNEKQYDCEVIRQDAGTGKPIYKVYIADLSDNPPLFSYKVDYTFINPNKYILYKPKKECTIKIDEKQYTGTLQSETSTASTYSIYPSYRYSDKNENVHFEINTKGELCSFYAGIHQIGQELSSAALYERAIQILRDYVNINHYTIDIQNETESNQYKLVLSKKLDGYETTEKCYISLYKDGFLNSLRFYMKNEIDVNDHITVSMEDVRASIYSRIDEIICDEKNQYERLYVRITSFIITKLSSGNYGFICNVTLNVPALKTGEYSTIRENLLVCVVELD